MDDLAIRIAHQQMTVEQREDGCLLLSTPETLGDYPEVLTDRIAQWAQQDPQRLFMAERDGEGGWTGPTYAQAYDSIRSLGQALLSRGLSAERPILILSGNSVDHALLAFAGMHVGVPAAAISPAYSTVSTDFSKLRHVLDILTPGLVFVDRAGPFARAVSTAVPADVEVVVGDGSGFEDRPSTPLSALKATAATADVERARAAQAPDDVAKFLFTSGSTGMPKAVPNTHRMLCSNQQMLLQAFPFLGEEPPVLIDWLPWNHTFGGNQNLGISVYNGGTFYIDDGRPTERDIARTAAALREISPTIYFNVPKGYEALLPYLKADAEMARNFFATKVIFYAGASLPEAVWKGYPELAKATVGKAPPLITSLGATETAPCSLAARVGAQVPGEIGVPNPGVSAKLVPVAGKLELRLRGPNVMPGYWRDPQRTVEAFDEEGYYKIGDAVRFIDRNDPDRGMFFDGRVAEDFKLSSGVWVNVAAMRLKALQHFAPLVRDLVIAGADREDIRALLVLDPVECSRAVGSADASHAALKQALKDRLMAMSSDATGSSTRLAAVAVLEGDLSLDAGEVTDKGSLNSRLILSLRADSVEALYSDAPTTITLN